MKVDYRDKSQLYQAMKNGYDMYLTGCYQEESYITNTKHIELEEGVNLPLEQMSQELLDINSAFIYNIPKISNNFYIEAKENTDTPIYSHIHQKSGDRISYDNINNIDKIKITKYTDYNADFKVPGYIQIIDNADLFGLIEDVKEYGKTGKIAKMNLRLINSCTWNYSACSLNRLTRCRVSKDFNIYPCINSTKYIGKITDDYFEIIRSASIIVNKTKIARNCEGCEAQRYCSKCAMLPDGIDDKLFCQTMKNSFLICEYIYKSMIFGNLIESSSTFSGVQWDEIHISNSNYSLVYDHVNEQPKNQKYYLFTAFKLKDSYYVLSYKTSKLFKTDERFIYIAESQLKAMSMEAAVERYASMFGIEKSEARAQFVEGMRIIKEAMII